MHTHTMHVAASQSLGEFSLEGFSERRALLEHIEWPTVLPSAAITGRCQCYNASIRRAGEQPCNCEAAGILHLHFAVEALVGPDLPQTFVTRHVSDILARLCR